MHSVDRDEEALRRRLVVQVAEGEAEAVVTFEPGSAGGSGVHVPQTVHLHIVLSEVLSGRHLGPPRLRLQTSKKQKKKKKKKKSDPTIELVSTVSPDSLNKSSDLKSCCVWRNLNDLWSFFQDKFQPSPVKSKTLVR